MKVVSVVSLEVLPCRFCITAILVTALSAVLLPVGAAGAAEPFIPFSRGVMTDIDGSEKPSEADIIKSIPFLAAGGEFEPFSLALYAETSGEWSIETGDLVSGDAVIPASSLEISALRYGNPGRYSYFEDWTLEPGAVSVTLEIGKTAWLWLTLHVPEQAAPGDYTGSISFVNGTERLSIPVHLEVLPFDLEPADGVNFYLLSTISPYGQYYRAVKDPASVRPKAVDFYRELKDHGMTGLSAKSTDFPYIKGDIDGLIAEVEAALEAGLDGPVLWNMTALIDAAKGGDSYDFNGRMDNWNKAEGLARLRDIRERVVAESKKRGWPEVIYYPIDEPGTQFEDRRFLLQSMHLLVVLSREIGRLDARAHSTITECVDERHNTLPEFSVYPDQMRDLWDEARPYLHIRNYGYGYPQGRTNLFHEMADARNRGQEVWFYYNKAIQSRDRFSGRMYFGLWGWKVRARGLTAWTYPGGRTVQFELVREGIDDFKYLALLEKLLDTGGSESGAAKAARAFLDSIAESVFLDDNGFIGNWEKTAAVFAERQGFDTGSSDTVFLDLKRRTAGHIQSILTKKPQR